MICVSAPAHPRSICCIAVSDIANYIQPWCCADGCTVFVMRRATSTMNVRGRKRDGSEAVGINQSKACRAGRIGLLS